MVLPNDIDLLNPPPELEKKKHKLKRLVDPQFDCMKSVCFPGTTSETVMTVMGELKYLPSRNGRARLTEPLYFARMGEHGSVSYRN